MEYVQFGDTEIPLSNFKTALEKLNEVTGEEASSGLQIEFEVSKQTVYLIVH